MTSSTIEVRGLGEDDVTCVVWEGLGGMGVVGQGGGKEAGCVWVGTKVRSVTGDGGKGRSVCVCVGGGGWYTHRCCP